MWHRRAFRLARRLHEQVRFDLVHQVNLIGFREPGYTWKLGVPFVWGPVGGTQNYPWAFLKATHIGGALNEIVRTVVNNFQLRFSRRVRQATRKAAAVLTANSTGQRDFARAHGIEPMLLLETGLRQVVDRPRTRSTHGQPFRILWSGEFSTRKALPLLIHALAQLPDHIHFELRVLGDGPLKARWQRLADRTEVGARTTWLGWIPLQEALKQYTWADAFAFTSLRDTSGNVVLEALGVGLPVICLAHQGVGDIVTDASGIRVPVTNPRAVIDRLTESVALLAGNPAKWEELSRGAVARARDFLWERQGERMLAIYKHILQDRVDWLEEAPVVSSADSGAAVTAGGLAP
jgi:glycosyltransferase involved in cell wall biosynthesis